MNTNQNATPATKPFAAAEAVVAAMPLLCAWCRFYGHGQPMDACDSCKRLATAAKLAQVSK